MSWRPIINASDRRRDMNKKDAGKAPHTSMRRQLTEHLKNDGGRVWAAVDN